MGIRLTINKREERRYIYALELVYLGVDEQGIKDMHQELLSCTVEKKRIFYTQGDYGLFQCSKPCCQEAYDNEEAVRAMISQQKDMRIPESLIPRCPHCGAPMTVNLRCDDTFVQDEGWYRAKERYEDFVRRHQGLKVVYLELGVGANTPVIIKYPFWRMTAKNPQATYACINYGEAMAPDEIREQSICINEDIRKVLECM